MDGLSRLWAPQSSSQQQFQQPQQHLQQAQSKNKGRPIPNTQDDSDNADLIPPRPPPKDPGYSSPYSPFAASLAGRSQSSLLPPKSTPNTPHSPALNRWQDFTSGVQHKLGAVMGSVSAASSQVSLVLPATSPPANPTPSSSSAKGSKFRLPRIRRRPSTSPTVASTVTNSNEEEPSNESRSMSVHGDESISTPWGFQHNLHVDEELSGLPVEWAQALRDAGYSAVDIQAMYAKQQRPAVQPSSASSASSSSSHAPVIGSSSSTVVVPRPRKDSIKNLEKSIKAADAIQRPVPHINIPDRTHARDTSEDNVTISVATPVRRSPSTLRRIPVPSPRSPPPSYDAHPANHGPSQSGSSTVVPEKPRQQPIVTNPDRTLSPVKSTGSIRQALQNTLSHARSNASLRKMASNISDGSSSRIPPPPTASSSALNRLATKKSAEGPGTFWDDDDDSGDEEQLDQVSALTPLGGKKASSRSLRMMSSTLPPRLELNLPSLDDNLSTGSGRKNSSDSINAPSFATSSSLTPKPSSSAEGSFIALDLGGNSDLGLGDWGTELLKAVTPSASSSFMATEGNSKPAGRPTTSDSAGASSASYVAAKHSSQSSTVPSPNSFSTTFSMAPSASSQSSHVPPSQPQSASRPFSLYPVTPLNLPPHKKVSTAKPQPALPSLPPPTLVKVTPDSQAGSNGEVKVKNKRISRLMVQNVRRSGEEDSPAKPIAPAETFVKELPTPPTIEIPVAVVDPPLLKSTAKDDAEGLLSVSISPEYMDDEEDDGLLPYMRSPGPMQATFPKPPTSIGKMTVGPVMSRSTSTSTSGSSSRSEMADSTSFGSSGVTEYGASRSTLATIPSPTANARPFSTMTVTPAALAAAGPVSRPVSSVPYDAVLDDWLEGEGEEDSGQGRPETVYEPASIIDEALKSSPLMPKKGPSEPYPPPTPTITLNGETQGDKEDNYDELDELPPILVPMADMIRAGNVRNLGHFEQVAEGQYGGVYAARVGISKTFVAVKTVEVTKANQPKFTALRDELRLLEDIQHENVLTYTGVVLVRNVLWLEMELMDRSLADVLAFIPEGLVVPETHMARFANDMLEGLDYLQGKNIAHRDVRSDNLLLSRAGILKLADFSSATVTSAISPKRTSTQGQPPFWMAPEMRSAKPYDPHEADIWSVGATVWEVAEGGDPPFIDAGDDVVKFGDRWPELSSAEIYSENLHQFLELCSNPPGQRPRAVELLRTSFVRGACPTSDIMQLLDQVRDMEEELRTRSIYTSS